MIKKSNITNIKIDFFNDNMMNVNMNFIQSIWNKYVFIYLIIDKYLFIYYLNIIISNKDKKFFNKCI